MIFENKILDIYRSMAYVRCDDTGIAFYFSPDDFPGLISRPYSFNSSHGHTLHGYFYYYTNVRHGRIVIFDHGFGGGHRSYMKEIEMLCSHGFLVFAYDHTGCMESGGENTCGMAQSLCDLNDCLCALKSEAELSEHDFSVMGHSWGGFSTLNIIALHPDITHIVALCGFASVERLVDSYFSGLLAPYRKPIMRLEHASNPNFVGYDALKTLEHSRVSALLVYSDNDPVCKKKYSYDALYAVLSDNPNVKFVLAEGKGHNPNYTDDAVAYLGEYIAQKNKLMKNGSLDTDEKKRQFVDSFDWNRMTEQDVEIWQKIFDHLENKLT